MPDPHLKAAILFGKIYIWYRNEDGTLELQATDRKVTEKYPCCGRPKA